MLSGLYAPKKIEPALSNSGKSARAFWVCTIKCSGAYSLLIATACAKLSAIKIRLWPRALLAVSARGKRASWRAIACSVCAANCALVVTNITWLSAPCSAWESRSLAINSGSAASSAMTNTSEGPAGISMAVPLCTTWRLASVTKALPGPKILSTLATVSVPCAMAKMACAPPTA